MTRPCPDLLDSSAHWMANSKKNVLFVIFRGFISYLNEYENITTTRVNVIICVTTTMIEFSDNRQFFRRNRNFRRIEIFEESSTKRFIRIKMTDMNFLFSISELKFLMNFHKNFLIYFESAHAFYPKSGSKNDSKYIKYVMNKIQTKPN